MNRPSKQRAGKTRASVVVGTVLAASCAHRAGDGDSLVTTC